MKLAEARSPQKPRVPDSLTWSHGATLNRQATAAPLGRQGIPFDLPKCRLPREPWWGELEEGRTEGRRERASGVKAGESQTSKNNREYIVFGGWSGVSQPRVRFQAHCHKSEGARLWPDWQDLLHAERLISLEARFRKIWQFKCFELCLGQSNFA